jgi:hypothetical protein
LIINIRQPKPYQLIALAASTLCGRMIRITPF